mmetsp:Transcript_64825/g.186283  ORF Transcript_64825/g.186283 Transcript_64825/m.186283 type:complete len:140 (-) Transcript_64825:99-518(-)
MGGDGDEGKGFVARAIAWAKEKALKLGQAALLAYLLIDVTVYAVLGLVVRSAFRAMRGTEPWEDPRGFLVAAAATWAGNNATRPLRLAGAAALAPGLQWTMGYLQKRWNIGKLLAAFALAAGYGGAVGLLVIGWVVATH